MNAVCSEKNVQYIESTLLWKKAKFLNVKVGGARA